MVFVAQQVVILVVSCLAIMGAGSLVAPRSEPALRSAIGIAAPAHTLFFLALIGQLRTIPVAIVVLIAIAGLTRNAAIPRHVPVALAVLFAAMFVIVLRPPLAFDETLYHLPFIRGLVESGGLAFRDRLRFPVFPQMHELLCVPLYLAGGDVATHMMSWIEVAVTAALLIEWGNRFSRGAGLLAAALFCGGPIIVQFGTVTYVDVALAFFVTAGFYCLDLRRYALSGFFLGTACSVKYLGGYFAVAAVVIVLIANRRAVITLIAGCLAAALPTTVWLTLMTGDPLFPFLRHGIWDLPSPPATGAVHLERIVRVVWDVAFARDRVNHQPPFTPFLIVIVAIVIAAAVRDVRARAVAFLALGYIIVFSFLPQDSRYLISLLPLLSLVSAVAVADYVRRIEWAAIIAVAPAVAYAVYTLSVRGLPPVTPEAREAYLRQRVPAYEALMHAGRSTVYVCGGAQLKSYARGELLGDYAGPYAYDRILGTSRNTASIAASLHRIGADDLLAVSPLCTPVQNDGGMDLIYEDRAAQLWRVRGR